MKSRKRKLSYDNNVRGKEQLPRLGEISHKGKPISDGFAQTEWLRRMEGFDIGSTRSAVKYSCENQLSASRIAQKFKNAVDCCEIESSQESEIDIDWLPLSDDGDVDKHKFSNKASRLRETDDTFDHSDLETVPEIGFQSTPDTGHSPIIHRNSVTRESPVNQCSPIIQRTAVNQCMSVSSRKILHCSPVIQSRSAVEEDCMAARKMLMSLRNLWPSALRTKADRRLIACYNSEDDDASGCENTDSCLKFKHSPVPISQYESDEDIMSYKDGDDEAKKDGEETDGDEDDDDAKLISSPPATPVMDQCTHPDVGSSGFSRPSDLSDKIQRIFLTPERNFAAGCEETVTVETTSKKRQKFLRGGLAEQLNRLVRKQRTTTSCWIHRGKQTLDGKVLLCEVLSCVTDRGLVVTRCKVSQSDSEPKETLVLFDSKTSQRCKIKPSTVLKIHPPWQVLKLTESLDAILNTLQCSVHSHCEEVGPSLGGGRDRRETNMTLATWTCSCPEDLPYSAVCYQNLGPVNSFPTLLCYSNAANDGAGNNKDNHRGMTSGLETCCSSQSTSGISDACVSSSILECIEQQGGGIDVDITFCGIVQRIFCHLVLTGNETGVDRASDIQWSVLVQDFHGFLCEVLLPRRFKPGSVWEKLTAARLGSTWTFQNFRVGRRLTKPKFGRLFSIIDSVWRPDSGASMASQDDSASSHYETCAPGFCYTLHATEAKASCRLRSSETSAAFSPHSYRLLKDVTMDRGPRRARLSFEARILHIMESEDLQHFYISDDSLEEEINGSSILPYIVVLVDKAVVLSGISVRQSAIFEDVSSECGKYTADEYSRIMSSDQHSPQKVKIISPKLPMLSISSELHSLVNINGRIVDVDEETAYAWSVCNICETADLGADLQNCFLYCDFCKIPVTNPLTRVRLDVYVCVSTMPDTPVKVKLLQNTIESLLPSTESIEAYEAEHVLGKEVQLVGLVTSKTWSGSSFKQIYADEIDVR